MDNYIGNNAVFPFEGPAMDRVTLMTLSIFIFSVLLLFWFGRFTLNLIKQHRNIYDLLFELEEEEKKKR